MKAVFATLILTAALPAAASPPRDEYRSTTADYTPYPDASIADWRMANEAMGPMHGRMGHMMGVPAKPVDGKEAGHPPAQSGSMGTGGAHHHMGGQP